MTAYMLDMDMPLDEVAEIFYENEWGYAAHGTFGFPDEDGIAAQLMALAIDVDEKDLDYMYQGRLALVRDPEINGAFQIAIVVGYLYNEDEDPFDA